MTAEKDYVQLGNPERNALQYIPALRPHQWVKNGLVFVPMLAQHNFAPDIIFRSLAALAVFCVLASSSYLVNDLLDLPADREHPRKRNRPLASGAVPPLHARLLAALLLVTGIGLAVAVDEGLAAIGFVYVAASLAYSLHLKRRMVIDICLLAGLYTLRIVAGGVATGIVLSVWLLAFSLFFFLSLAAMKRQAELVDGESRGAVNPGGRGYVVSDLPMVSQLAIASGLIAVLVLALYLNSPDVRELYHLPEALWGICLVLVYWIVRTAMIAHRGDLHDDPVVFAISDRISLTCGALVALFAFAAMAG